jgi:hypothetical protein
VDAYVIFCNFSWVKLLNEKLLIFFKENSKKANIIYDLSECTIKGNYFREKIYNLENFSHKRNTVTALSLKKTKLELERKKTRSRGTMHSFSTSCNSEVEDDLQETHLNYLIDIDHPYQKKCQIKGCHVFETLEFFRKIKRFVE